MCGEIQDYKNPLGRSRNHEYRNRHRCTLPGVHRCANRSSSGERHWAGTTWPTGEGTCRGQTPPRIVRTCILRSSGDRIYAVGSPSKRGPLTLSHVHPGGRFAPSHPITLRAYRHRLLHIIDQPGITTCSLCPENPWVLTRWGSDAMPERVDQYRLNAEKCSKLAQTFKDPNAKRKMLAMAGAWLMLAVQRVKHVEMPALDPRSVPCPRCQSPMMWYSADRAGDRRTLQHSFQCEQCGFVCQSDEQRQEIRSVKRSWQQQSTAQEAGAAGAGLKVDLGRRRQ